VSARCRSAWLNARIERRTLAEFQRWAIRKAYTFIPFENYDVNAKGRGGDETPDLFGGDDDD
jgi:hypothetical protein